MDLYNAFNADAIMTQQNSYGGDLDRRPLTVIQPRFVKFWLVGISDLEELDG